VVDRQGVVEYAEGRRAAQDMQGADDTETLQSV